MNWFYETFNFLNKGYGIYFLTGVRNTVILAFVTVVFSFTLGLVPAFMRLSKSKLLKGIATVYVEVIRGTPLYVQLLILYGAITMQRTMFGDIDLSRWIPCIFALTINGSAYVSEIIRAGILAVDHGQTEAARSLGMTYPQAMRYIILPQAVKNILPALGNEFVVVIKESAIVSILGVNDLMFGANLTKGATYNTMGPLLFAAFLYLCLTFPTSKLIAFIERRMRKGDKR